MPYGSPHVIREFRSPGGQRLRHIARIPNWIVRSAAIEFVESDCEIARGFDPVAWELRRRISHTGTHVPEPS